MYYFFIFLGCLQHCRGRLKLENHLKGRLSVAGDGRYDSRLLWPNPRVTYYLCIPGFRSRTDLAPMIAKDATSSSALLYCFGSTDLKKWP